MSYEIYHWIFIGAMIMAGLMLALTVFLFFYFQIPRVIGDLTGSNARKAIEDIRQQNTKTGVKVHKTSQVNRERGKVTAKMTAAGKVVEQHSGGVSAMKTGKISTQKLSQEAAQPAAETTVLNPPRDETMLLTPQSWGAPAPAPAPSGFMIEYELTFIHSDELIG